HNALAFEPARQAEAAHVFLDTARLAQREEEAAAGRLAPAADAAFGDRLARDGRERIERARMVRDVRVGNPRHLALARPVIGGGHVDARTDEVLLDQLVRVAAGDP